MKKGFPLSGCASAMSTPVGMQWEGGRDAGDVTPPTRRAWPRRRWHHGGVWGGTSNPSCDRLLATSLLLSLIFKGLFCLLLGVCVLHISPILPACYSRYFRLFLASRAILFLIHIVPTPPTSWTVSFTGSSPAPRRLTHHHDLDKFQLLGDPSLRS